MKAYLLLLHYLMTWLRPVMWLMWLGLGLLGIVLVLGVVGEDHAAYGFAIYASILLLAVPYLFVWHPFRVMLGSRRLALLPGFRVKLGLTLLVFTLLLAACLPLASSLFWPGIVPPRFMLAAFIGASMFTFALQWAVASRHAVLVYSIGPFVLIFAGSQLGPLFMQVLSRQDGVVALTLAAALGWSLGLWILTSRRDFRPPGKAPTHARDYVWDGRADWLGILLGNYRGPVKSAAGTLLLGIPDGFSGRLFSMLNLVVIAPLMGLFVPYITGFAQIANTGDAWAGTFLIFSLTTCVVTGYGNGELAARCRLVWLRQEGSRAEQWRQLERRLFADTQLLALIVLPVTGVVLVMFDAIAFDPVTYCLMAVAGNILGNYFSLAARLSQWSMFVQLLIALGTAAGLILGRVAGVLSLPVLAALMLGLVLLFRQQALQRFASVDWYRLRPASPTLKEKMS